MPRVGPVIVAILCAISSCSSESTGGGLTSASIATTSLQPGAAESTNDATTDPAVSDITQPVTESVMTTEAEAPTQVSPPISTVSPETVSSVAEPPSTTIVRDASASAGGAFCQANETHSFSTNEISNEMANYASTAEAEAGIDEYRDLIEARYATAPADLVDWMTPFYLAVVDLTDLARRVGYDDEAFRAGSTDIFDRDGVHDGEAIYRIYVAEVCEGESTSGTLPGEFCDAEPASATVRSLCER